jgi:hypothetical protein
LLGAAICKCKVHNKEAGTMAITSVSRWKGNPEDTGLAKEIAPVLKRHGAVSVRLGFCHSGAYAGQTFGVLTFPDWATYGRAMQGLSGDPDYKRIFGELSKKFELQERSLMVTEDL